MRARGHQITAVTAALAWSVSARAIEPYLPAQIDIIMSDTSLLWFLAWVWVGCLLPDIDNKKSRCGKHVYRLLRLRLRHRGITHGIWFLGLWVALAWVTGWLWVAALAFGVGHHIAMDFLSKGSIALFYPLGSWKIKELSGGVRLVLPKGRSGIYTVGRRSERAMVIMVTLLNLLYCFIIQWVVNGGFRLNVGL